METYQMYYGGAWHDAVSGESFDSFNPYTGKPWARIPRGGSEDAARAIEVAHTAFADGEWSRMTATERGALMRRVGDLIAAPGKVW